MSIHFGDFNYFLPIQCAVPRSCKLCVANSKTDISEYRLYISIICKEPFTHHTNTLNPTRATMFVLTLRDKLGFSGEFDLIHSLYSTQDSSVASSLKNESTSAIERKRSSVGSMFAKVPRVILERRGSPKRSSAALGVRGSEGSCAVDE